MFYLSPHFIHGLPKILCNGAGQAAQSVGGTSVSTKAWQLHHSRSEGLWSRFNNEIVT